MKILEKMHSDCVVMGASTKSSDRAKFAYDVVDKMIGTYR